LPPGQREWVDAPAVGREVLTPYDPAECLTSAEALAAFLADAEATADPAYIEHARSRGAGPGHARSGRSGLHRQFRRCRPGREKAATWPPLLFLVASQARHGQGARPMGTAWVNGPALWLTRPTASPRPLTTTPPELPPAMGASICNMPAAPIRPPTWP
jgi:hypothetical protein